MHWYTCKSLYKYLRKSCRTVGWMPCQAKQKSAVKVKVQQHAMPAQRVKMYYVTISNRVNLAYPNLKCLPPPLTRQGVVKAATCCILQNGNHGWSGCGGHMWPVPEWGSPICEECRKSYRATCSLVRHRVGKKQTYTTVRISKVPNITHISLEEDALSQPKC